jgi:hypothetical protein
LLAKAIRWSPFSAKHCTAAKKYVGADDAKDTVIEPSQKVKQQRKLDAAAVRQIHSIP